MENRGHSQLELFSHIKGGGEGRALKSGSFFGYMRNYEKTILIIICFITISIISFSLGVEKGKQSVISELNSNKTQSSLTSSISSQNQPQAVVQTQYPDTIKKPPVTGPAPTKESMQNYTIQVASYKTKSYAQKELEALRKKGFSPLILSKGGYVIVCVGNFPNKEVAKSLLVELKKKYRDSIIRRL